MSEVTVFKNSNGNVAVVLASLTKVAFIHGKFFTKDKRLEAELTRCAETNEFGIYIDKNEASIDADMTDPMEALRAKIRRELEAEMNNPAKINAGNSQVTEQQFVNSVATTQDNELTGGSQLTEEEAKLKAATGAPVNVGLLAALDKQTNKS